MATGRGDARPTLGPRPTPAGCPATGMPMGFPHNVKGGNQACKHPPCRGEHVDPNTSLSPRLPPPSIRGDRALLPAWVPVDASTANSQLARASAAEKEAPASIGYLQGAGSPSRSGLWIGEASERRIWIGCIMGALRDKRQGRRAWRALGPPTPGVRAPAGGRSAPPGTPGPARRAARDVRRRYGVR